MSEILQPHGGHASEGYGRPREQGADFTHGIALYLEKSVYGLMPFVP